MGCATLKRRLFLLACAGLLAILAGCGGDDGGGSPGAGPGVAPAGTLSVQQRALATDRLVDRFRQITGGVERPSADMWEQLRAWVMAQPEFVDAGVGDQVLWARFADGRYFLFTDNWRPLPAAPLAAQSALKQAAPTALLKGELPESDRALMLSDSHPDFADSGPLMDRMSDALFQSGWSPTAKRSMDIATLRGQGTLGFLFLTAHSGIIGPTGQKEFAMITDDRATSDNDEKFATELQEGTLIYHRDRRLLEKLGWNDGLRYAFTSKFVSRYLRFSPESLVILVACHSGSDEAKGFRDAFVQGGAGTVIGWDGNTNAQAFETVDLMVDRLAGANVVRPVTPANRPFAFADVWRYLDQKGLLKTPSPDGLAAPTPVVSVGDGFSILRPVLRELELTGVDRLLLHGDFGTQPATVMVGGRPFTATPYVPGIALKVDLDPAAQGEVVVSTRWRQSNPRVLGSWKGQVSYRQTVQSGCSQPFSHTVDVDLHLRADMHPVRYQVDGPLYNNQRLLMHASDTGATWKAEGSCTRSDGDTETWSGSGHFPLALFGDGAPTPPQNPNFIAARFDALQSRFQLQMSVGSSRLITVQTNDLSYQRIFTFDWGLSQIQNDGSNPDLLGWGHFLPLDGSRNVAAGQFQKSDPNDAAQSLTFQWQNMPAAPAYDDKIPR